MWTTLEISRIIFPSKLKSIVFPFKIYLNEFHVFYNISYKNLNGNCFVYY